MTAFALLLLGTIAGFGLNWLRDLVTERRQVHRQDVVWRREHFVDAAADLVHASWELAGANARLARTVFALDNAQRVGRVDIIANAQQAYEKAVAEQWPWPAATHKALQALRLYGPADVVAAGQTLNDTAMRMPEAAKSEERFTEATAAADELVRCVRTHVEPAAPRLFGREPRG